MSPSGLVWRDSHRFQFHDHFVPDARGPSGVLRWRHINILRKPRVIRDHIQKMSPLLQGAHDLGSRPLQDANDSPGRLAAFGRPFRPGLQIPPDQDVVPVHRRAGCVLRHGQRRQLGIIRL